MKSLLFAAVLAASSLPALAADATSPLDRLNVFAGTWKTESEKFDTPYSSAGTVSSTLVNQCWKAGNFFICNQSVNGQSAVLLVFTYKGGDSFNISNIPAAGGYASNGSLVVNGGVWTFPGQTHKFGQVVYFRTVNIYSDNDNLDYREEYSTDQQTWTLMAKGHEARLRNPATVP
ncbi:MAG TPA: hypothetical protein VHP13_10080 [Gammaproteobacteria bacterium]|jgi:hypothetical protein|nr:hypothetical protein [Gammaproteobacteria bacterium]